MPLTPTEQQRAPGALSQGARGLLERAGSRGVPGPDYGTGTGEQLRSGEQFGRGELATELFASAQESISLAPQRPAAPALTGPRSFALELFSLCPLAFALLISPSEYARHVKQESGDSHGHLRQLAMQTFLQQWSVGRQGQ
jgi:hypothetical protein